MRPLEVGNGQGDYSQAGTQVLPVEKVVGAESLRLIGNGHFDREVDVLFDLESFGERIGADGR